MRLAAILIMATMGVPATAWAQTGTTVLFIGNSFTYGWGSSTRHYRTDTVTDLNHEGIGGVPAVFKSFTDQAGLAYKELQRAESELRLLNAELEQRVEARTAELKAVQEELVRKERLAALGQLTATVSHELRNPMGTMKNAIAAIKKLTAGKEKQLTASLRLVDRSISRCDNRVFPG